MNQTTDEHAILEGHISIEAVLRSQSRVVHSILVEDEKQTRGIAQVSRIARSVGISLQRVSKKEIDEQAAGQSRGGIIAHVGPRRFAYLDELVQNSKIDGQIPLFVMLDGIEDPFNFGHATRALYAAGVDGLIVRPRNWMSAAGTVARASAGASEYMPTAVAESVEAATEALRGHGFTVACTDTRQAMSI
jgi:23S rRNA (guanosine2251-2'-O)-methyltransferase